MELVTGYMFRFDWEYHSCTPAPGKELKEEIGELDDADLTNALYQELAQPVVPVSTGERDGTSSPTPRDAPTHETSGIATEDTVPGTPYFGPSPAQDLESDSDVLVDHGEPASTPESSEVREPVLHHHHHQAVLRTVPDADASEGVGNNGPTAVGSNPVQETVPRSANSTPWFLSTLPRIVWLL